MKFEGKTWLCPDCQTPNDLKQVSCEACGYRLTEKEKNETKGYSPPKLNPVTKTDNKKYQKTSEKKTTPKQPTQEATSKVDRCEKIYDEAYNFYRKRKYDDAIKKLKQISSYKKGDKDASHLISKCREILNDGNFETASEFYKRASSDADYKKVIEYLTEIDREYSKIRDAEKLLNSCYEILNDRNYEAARMHFSLARSISDYVNAIECLDKIEGKYSKLKEAKDLEKEIRAAMEDLRKKRKTYDEAIKLIQDKY